MTRSATLVALLTAVASQDSPAPATVSIPVAVTQRGNARPVSGLTAAHFALFEDGREQVITSVAETPAPVSIAIVVDSSDTMAGFRQQLAQQVVERLVATLSAEDEVSLLTYDGKVTMPVPWTSAREFPKLEWARWKTMPTTELLQTVYQGIGLVNQAKNPRTAVVAISDAEQVGSVHRLQDFVKSRRESETSIYGVRTADLLSDSPSIGGPRPNVRGGGTIWESRGALVSFEDLVRDSGGLVVPARTTSEVTRAVDALLQGLRRQYLLTFTSSKPPDGTYRKLKVELRRGSHKLRYRSGYLAQ